jgi:hypothetical protein
LSVCDICLFVNDFKRSARRASVGKIKLFSIVFNCLRKNSVVLCCVSREKGVILDKLGGALEKLKANFGFSLGLH